MLIEFAYIAELMVGATGRFSREVQNRVPVRESSAFYIYCT